MVRIGCSELMDLVSFGRAVNARAKIWGLETPNFWEFSLEQNIVSGMPSQNC